MHSITVGTIYCKFAPYTMRFVAATPTTQQGLCSHDRAWCSATLKPWLSANHGLRLEHGGWLKSSKQKAGKPWRWIVLDKLSGAKFDPVTPAVADRAQYWCYHLSFALSIICNKFTLDVNAKDDCELAEQRKARISTCNPSRCKWNSVTDDQLHYLGQQECPYLSDFVPIVC